MAFAGCVQLFDQKRYCEAEMIYRECVRCAEESPLDPILLWMVYSTLAHCLKEQSRNEDSLPWLQKAYDLADGVPLGQLRALGTAINLADTYRQLGRTNEASHWQEIFEQLKERFRKDKLSGSGN